MKKIILIFLVLLSYSGFSGGWEVINHMDQSGFGKPVKIIDSNNAIALLGNIIVKTTNGGLTWAEYTDAKNRFNSIQILDSLNWFGTYYHVILKSIDGGKNWDTLTETIYSSGPFFAINKSHYFRYDNDNLTLMESKDAGETWINRPKNVNQDVNSLFYFDDQNGFLIGLSENIFYTIDGGNTWAKRSKSISDSTYLVQFLDKNIGYCLKDNYPKDNYFMKTSDAGYNWQIDSTSLFRNMQYFSIYDTNTRWIVCGVNKDSLMQTKNNGKSWNIFKPINYNFSNYTIIDSSNTFLIGKQEIQSKPGFSYIAKLSSSNSIIFDDYFKNQQINNIMRLNENNYLININDIGIYKSINKGISWELIGKYNNLKHFHFDDSLHGIATASISNRDSIFLLFETFDGGVTWKVQNKFKCMKNSGDLYKQDNFYLIDDNHGWLLTPCGEIYYTSNAGRNWEFRKNEISSSTSFNGFYAKDSLNIFISLIINNAILPTEYYKSNDGGWNWKIIDASEYYSIIDNIPNDFNWKIWDNKIYHKNNLKDTFKFEYAPFFYSEFSRLNEIFQMPDSTVWCVGDEGMILKYNPNLYFQISGRVIESTKGIANAEISNGEQIVFSDSLGYFHFTNINQGIYVIKVKKSDYLFDYDSIQVTVSNTNLKNIKFLGKNISKVESVLNSLFSLFPNPTNSNKLNIELNSNSLNPISYQIISSTGFELSKCELNQNSKQSIDIESLSSGIYLLLLNIDGKIESKKFVVGR